MPQGLIPEFKNQTSNSILKLLAKAGQRKDVDCINYTGIVPMTAELPVFAFVSKLDVVIVLIDWQEPGKRDCEGEKAVHMLTDFIEQYMHALANDRDEDDIPPILGVVVSNKDYYDYGRSNYLWELLDVKVINGIKAIAQPNVYYAHQYHAVALAQYKAFYIWCANKGYIKRDPYAFEGIDADYDEMEFGLDEDEDDYFDDDDDDCEEDFEAILDKFINGPADAEIVKTNINDYMPTSIQISDIVDDIKKNRYNKSNNMKGVASVDISINVSHINFEDGDIRICITSRPGVYLHSERFYCHVYTDDYYPVCSGDDIYEENNGKIQELIIVIPCQRVWLPGNYFIIISDSQDFSYVNRIDFTLDNELTVVQQSEWKRCGSVSPEGALALCLSQSDNWNYVARTPGTVQIRNKIIQLTLTHFFNEFRKESLGNLPISANMLVCMNNPSRKFLEMLQVVVAPDYDLKFIDCSKLFDASRANPYEMLPETLDNIKGKILCLTHLSELIGSSGKVIMRQVVDIIHQSEGQTPIWLCGTRQDIDEAIRIYPSLKKYFNDDSWLKQRANTPYELVQAFISIMADNHIEVDLFAKPLLVQAIIEGCEMGRLVDWTTDDIKHFVESEIIPRYIKRNVADFNINDDRPLVDIKDIPIEKLTDPASSYEHSIIELKAMIGLEEVKHGISTMANQAHLFIERRRRGLKTSENQVYHSIFTGNPGTGKTTVARQLGKIYHALGLLSKGEVIAVDRTNLIGQYIGQTEENMKSILEEAKGNVLFIDEAYTLFTGSEDPKDFGRRVIDCLLTVLTQPNADMLIVFAGYTKEMDAMLSTNPGLAGRFPYRYHFADYSSDQLMEIAKSLFEREEYTLTDDAVKELHKSISETVREKPTNFGNARWVEQFVRNGIIPAMADRIFATGSNDFQSIEACDVRKAYEKFNPKTIELKPRHKVAGFNA